MASIPLLCNICPKEPDFSDISHLLTHVASKGHLSHCFKATVRARQDPSTRKNLDRYERWFDRYQIQKLLSERMTAKESKDTSSKRSSTKVDTRFASGTKEKKACKRRAATTVSQPIIVDTPSPVKAEGVIDPQLSQSLLATPRHQNASPFLQGLHHDPGAIHRAYVPRMGAWQNASPSPNGGTECMINVASSPPQPASGPTRDAEDDSDYFQSFIRSPSRTAYPDPAEYGGLPMAVSPTKQEEEKTNVQLPRELSSETENTTLVQSPILKGVKWPGMSLFDSASLEAQRRRNQKKDESILEQMESNSAAVEQLEKIFWPDGSLKKERLITGNVESSPPRELTPPPKPTKRQRTKAKKPVLADLSTNAPKRGRRPRQRKIATPVSGSQASNLQELSEKALATLDEHIFTHPQSAHFSYNPIDDEEAERQLTFAATNNGRRRNFEIFSDDIDRPENYQQVPDPNTTEGSFAHGYHTLHSHSSSSTRRRIPLSARQPSSKSQVSAEPGRSSETSRPQTIGDKFLASIADNRENIPPALNDEGRVDDGAGPAIQQRITQRYFSVTGNQPPQFFSSLPSQMEFGGLAEPMYHGSTLNPLNTQFRPQHFPLYNGQAHFHYPTSTSRQNNGSSKLGNSSSTTIRSAKNAR